MPEPDANVITVGAINVDLIVGVERLPVAGETVNGHRFLQQGGGKSANQAVAASRVDAAVTLLGAVGDDDLGQAALQGLAGEGINVDACRTIAGEHTGLALIVVDDAGENQIAVAPGANESVDGAAIRGSLARLEPSPSTVMLLTLEFEDDALSAALDWAAEHRLRVIINPAPARQMSETMLSSGAILTPNRTEAALLAGTDDPEAAGRILSARTGAAVIVSVGTDGALLCIDDRCSRLEAMTVDAIDTTGAGDALNGILAAELARGAELEEALRVAMIGAALSTTRVGAQAGLPRRAAIVAQQGLPLHSGAA